VAERSLTHQASPRSGSSCLATMRMWLLIPQSEVARPLTLGGNEVEAPGEESIQFISK
jgi:hypothetical protein